ncbi:MAG: hypothetical protein E6J77_09100 [Deltaproteobacteria bacterium]|nr:MAG: hypothetical protein E6J77_09100 [Deltaproteobacteria bacterium]
MRSRVTAALASLVLFLCLAAGAQGQPCTVPLVGFGPIDPADGFPQYYLDSNNLALAQCLDSVCDPAFALPDPGQPITFPDNFPADFFYHRAQASMNGPNGQTFLLDIALLGSFINGTPVDGDQIVFSRLRVRATGVVPGATYTITHPFGVETVTADGVPPRLIDFTRNIGRVRLAFGLALNGDVGPFLTFLAGAVPPAPGTIGTGAADQTVTGSACGTNLFKVEGPDLPVGGIQTGLFNNVVGRRAELCGNSFVDLNEDCDLGAANGQPGSCCNANCTFTSATTACDDGNPCTTSAMCDGQGSCPVTGFTTIACTDNNACTTADTCDGAGNCANRLHAHEQHRGVRRRQRLHHGRHLRRWELRRRSAAQLQRRQRLYRRRLRSRDRLHAHDAGRSHGVRGRQPLYPERRLPRRHLHRLEPDRLHRSGSVPHHRGLRPGERRLLEPGSPGRHVLQRQQRLHADRHLRRRRLHWRKPGRLRSAGPVPRGGHL